MVKQALLLGCMSLLLVAGSSAQTTKAEVPHGGKVTVIVTHEVKDYAVWKKGFDAHGSFRTKAGFSTQGVYCDVKNPNWVTVVGEFPNAAAAEAFFTSQDLKDTMAKVGVIGKPDVKVLTVGAK
jgi:hypothetical protein